MKNINKFRYFNAVILIAAAVIVCAVSLICMMKSSEAITGSTVTQTSGIYMQELAIQKIGYVKMALDQEFSYIQILARAVDDNNIRSEDELEAFLEKLQDEYNFSYIAFMDNKGYLHSADGVYSETIIDGAEKVLKKNERFVAYNTTLTDGNIFLVGDCIPHIGCGGDEFEALFIGIESEVFKKELSLENASTHANIVDSDGNLIMDCGHEDGLITGDMVFDELEKTATFEDGYSIEKMQDDFETVDRGMLVCTIGGEKKYLFYEPVPDMDWYMLIVMPYSVMAENIDSMSYRLGRNAIISVTIIAAVLIVVLIAAYFSFKQSAAVIKEARAKAEEASLAKTEFLSHMSHDIRTPLNGIIGMTDIAFKNLDDKKRISDCLTKIDSSSQHLLSLINDVLELSRIESGKTKVVMSKVDIVEFMDRCADIIEGCMNGRKLQLIKKYGTITHQYLWADELHLRQIIMNILGNAVKFTPDGGKIFLRLTETGNSENKVMYRIEIEDTGKGMKSEYVEHIWDAFSQEDAAERTHYMGTGLGMTITKKFVDMLGGSISVDSRKGVGSCFVLRFAFDIDITAKETDGVSDKSEIRLDGMHVLVAEDNEINAEIAQTILEDAGAKVSIADDGGAVVDMFRKSPQGTYTCILKDIMMPVRTGIEATKAIRRLDRTDAKTVPIIAMTADAYTEDAEKTKIAGMNGHLSKPIDEVLLRKTLNELCL